MKSLALTALILILSACGSGGGDNVISAPANSLAAAPAPAGQDWTQTVSKTPAGGYVMGNPNAPLKLVEYGSRTCPTCGAFGQMGMRPLADSYVKSGKVSFEFRDFLVHAPDLGVALLGHCAGATPFFPILEEMFVEQPKFLEKLGTVPEDFQRRLQPLTPPQQATAWAEYLGYLDFVKQRGLTEAQARKCLGDPAGLATLAKISDEAVKQGVTGTPTFFLNGQQLQGAVTWAQIETALKGAGA